MICVQTIMKSFSGSRPSSSSVLSSVVSLKEPTNEQIRQAFSKKHAINRTLNRDLMLKLWKEGYSAGIIGEKLGVSRNTIVGAVHRLKAKGFDVGRENLTAKQIKSGVSGGIKRRNYQRRMGIPQNPSITVATLSAQKAPPMPKPPAPRKPTEGNRWVSFYDLGQHGCKWPHGDDRTCFQFCNDARTEGSSYCEEHTKLSINPWHYPRKTA